MEYVFLFIFGSIIGSFLNVVGLRWNSSLTLQGRSFCPVCAKKLSWWELVPVASYFLLRGRCSGCRTKISFQYPLVETLTGLVFVSLYSVLGPTIYYLLSTIIFCLYIVIGIYDIRHKIIPDPLVYSAIVLSFCALVLRFVSDLEFGARDFLAGPIIFLFFTSIWFLSRGRAMGFGDAKLGMSVGFLLGAAQGVSAIVLAFWIGAATALSYMLFLRVSLLSSSKKLTMKSEIPFAPFIIVGAFISLVLGLDILHVSQL